MLSVGGHSDSPNLTYNELNSYPIVRSHTNPKLPEIPVTVSANFPADSKAEFWEFHAVKFTDVGGSQMFAFDVDGTDQQPTDKKIDFAHNERLKPAPDHSKERERFRPRL
jgi:hypothetical protein